MPRSMLITKKKIIWLSSPWRNSSEQKSLAKDTWVLHPTSHAGPSICPTLSLILSLISSAKINEDDM